MLPKMLIRIIFAYIVIFTVIVTFAKTVEAEEYIYVEFAQGVKLNDAPWGASNWEGDFPTEFVVGYHQGNNDYYQRVEFQHTSNILDGPPFNDRDETWLDAVFYRVGARFDLK